MLVIDYDFIRGRKTSMSVADMCRAVGIKRSAVYKAELDGRIPPSVKDPGGRYWHPKTVLEFFESQALSPSESRRRRQK